MHHCGRFFQDTECLSKTGISVETYLLLVQQCVNVGDFTINGCLPKTGISVETCWLLLQQCFNVGDFTKQRKAFLRLISPLKRVYCCYNNVWLWANLPSNGMLISPWKHVYRCHNIQCGRFHKCYAQCHWFNYLYPRKITFRTVRKLYWNPNIRPISTHLFCDKTPTGRNIGIRIVT
jgi:hypothetical protein